MLFCRNHAQPSNSNGLRLKGTREQRAVTEARNVCVFFYIPWDALHDYEELGLAVNLNHAKSQEALRRQRTSFAQMIGIKNKTACLEDRQALGQVVKQMAGELGIAYQLDLGEQ